jgi:hypothetical protein
VDIIKSVTPLDLVLRYHGHSAGSKMKFAAPLAPQLV